jgi:Methyltransferase domain
MAGMSDDIAAWKAAGAANLRYNAPLGWARAARLVGRVCAGDPATLVDLGCGRGALLLDLLAALPAATGTGVDRDEQALAAASAEAERRGLAARARFVAGEAAAWPGRADTVVCIGSTHALGGMPGVLAAADRAGAELAVVADGAWVAPPSPWCLAHLGDLPAGLDAVASLVEGCGWRVEETDLSTLDEWDDFEGGWCAGVRSVRTPGALAFAAEREAQYREHYRGVLGFGWVVAVRAPGTRGR